MAGARFHEHCVRCGKAFPPDAFRTRCDCGGMIDVDYDLHQVRVDPAARGMLARYGDLLPVVDPANLVDVGAGDTPCVHARRLGARLGLPDLFLKDETKNPTGTTKDRPASVVMSYLKERGIFHFTSSATGNSSTAFAVACIKHPPFEHSIFVGERWLKRLTFDAHPRIHVWVVEGYDVQTVEAIRASRRWEREHGIPPEGGFFNLARREGLKTAFFEAVDQAGTAFDWYLQGVSTAMGAYAAYKGALQYKELGRVDRIPKMGLMQEATCCPQVRAFDEGSGVIEERHIFKQPDGIADALLKGNPADTYPYTHGMLMKAGGTFVAVTADEIRTAQAELHEFEGIRACAASSTTIAGLKKLVASGRVRPEERVLANITGSDRDPTRYCKRYTKLAREAEGFRVLGEVVEEAGP